MTVGFTTGCRRSGEYCSMIEFARREQLSIWIENFDGTITDIYLEQRRKKKSNNSNENSKQKSFSSFFFSSSLRRDFLCPIVCFFFVCFILIYPTTLVFEGQELCLRPPSLSLGFFVISHDDYMDGRQQPPADQLETMMEDRYRRC